jgi:hypothetical protein
LAPAVLKFAPFFFSLLLLLPELLQMSEQPNKFEMKKDMEFANAGVLMSHYDAYSIQENISIVTHRSDYKKVGLITFICKHGKIPRHSSSTKNVVGWFRMILHGWKKYCNIVVPVVLNFISLTRSAHS